MNIEKMNKKFITKYDVADALCIPVWLADFMLMSSSVFGNMRKLRIKGTYYYYTGRDQGITKIKEDMEKLEEQTIHDYIHNNGLSITTITMDEVVPDSKFYQKDGGFDKYMKQVKEKSKDNPRLNINWPRE